MARALAKWQTVLQPRHILAEQHRQEEAVSRALFCDSVVFVSPSGDRESGVDASVGLS